MRVIINNCNLDLRQLTPSELRSLIKGNDTRRTSLGDEYDLLIAESIRRSHMPEWRQVPETATLF